MSENEVERMLKTAIEAGIPAIATGQPGTGKTGWGLTLGGWPCPNPEHPKGHYIIQVIGSVREPTDIGGWPMRTENGIVLEPPFWAKQAAEKAEEGYHVIIIWDEMRTVTAPQQAALLKVIHENRVGDMDMPRSISHLAFANSVDDSAGGVPLEPPMANRFLHCEWKVNTTQWVKDMTMNRYAPQGYLTSGALEVLPRMRAEIASYIQHRQEQLIVMPKEESQRDGPWPSPRTWDYSAHLWATTPDESWDWRQELLARAVGFAAAADYINWRESLDLLDPELVLQGTYKQGNKKFIDSERPDRTFAMISSMMSLLAQNWTLERYEGAWKAFAYAADEGATDIAGAYIPDLWKTATGQTTPPGMEAKYIEAFRGIYEKMRELS